MKSNFSIFKVKILENNKVNQIFIFNGTATDHDNIKDLFSDEEIQENLKHTPKITFTDQIIHPDDTILQIKVKVLHEMNQSISLEELYIFCTVKTKLNSNLIYNKLTQSNKKNIDRTRLGYLTRNVKKTNKGPLAVIEKKKIYSYNDILELQLDQVDCFVDMVLGAKELNTDAPYIGNPYNIVEFDESYEKHSRQSLQDCDKNLLLNSNNIQNNSLYVVTAKDALTHIKSIGLSEEFLLKLYFPILYRNNVESEVNLEKIRNNLIKSNQPTKDYNMNHNQTIAMFYEVYKQRKNELKYDTKGIRSIYFNMISPNNMPPLASIFRIINATEEMPLIKYNPSIKQEKVFRLFCDKTTENGSKIPLLKKSQIFKLMKSMGKTSSVSVFIKVFEKDATFSFVCDFLSSGNVSISSEFETPMEVEDISQLINKHVNPVIAQVKRFAEESGYVIDLFQNIYDENIEIINIVYETQISIKKNFSMEKIKKCISSVFSEESYEKSKKEYTLRFKRVDNYSKTNAHEAFIIEKQKQGFRGTELINALVENFPTDMTKTKALDLLQKIAREIQVERGVNKRDIKIKKKPGFATTINVDAINGNINIRVDNIDNIAFIETIPVYIDSMVRLSQDTTTTSFSQERIQNVCKSEHEESEERLNNHEILTQNAKESTHNTSEEYENDDEDVKKKALMLFFGDEEEDDDQMGGDEDPETSSDSSIESAKIDFDEEEEEKTNRQTINDDSDSSVSSEDEEEDRIVQNKKETNVDFETKSNNIDEEEDEFKLSSLKEDGEEDDEFKLSSLKEDGEEEEDEFKLSSLKEDGEEEEDEFKLSSLKEDGEEDDEFKLSSLKEKKKKVNEDELSSTQKEYNDTTGDLEKDLNVNFQALNINTDIKSIAYSNTLTSSSKYVDNFKEREIDYYKSLPWRDLVKKSRKHIKFKEEYSTKKVNGKKCKKIKENKNGKELIAIDCEMLVGEDKDSDAIDDQTLLRVTVIDGYAPNKILLDTLVKTTSNVIDMRTSIHGITKKDLDEAKLTFKEARAKIMEFCSIDTIIIGHSLHNDLQSLCIRHKNIVDTNYLYQNYLNRQKNISLREIVDTVLHQPLPKVHDSVQEAQAAFFAALHLLENNQLKPNLVIDEGRAEKKQIKLKIEDETILSKNKKQKQIKLKIEDENPSKEENNLRKKTKKLQIVEEDNHSPDDFTEGKNIDNMTLRNYFQKKIENKDSSIILKQPQGKFNAYSKICQSNTKRQPVILTDKELARIQSEHKNFLREEDVSTYGTTKEKFHYICPRFWCLKTNTVIPPSEMNKKIENGKEILYHPTCGKVVPDNEDKIIPGHYVYEFYKEDSKKPDYKRYPNFATDKHPTKGVCLPCCFDKWSTPSKISSKQKCQGEEPYKVEEDVAPPKEEYIIAPDKFPLGKGRWGYLPISVQNLLNELSVNAQISKENTNLRENHPCLLRHGIESHTNQSFVSCLSDIMNYGTGVNNNSIRETKEIILNAINLDLFIIYQNGNLVTDFYDGNIDNNVDKYNKTNLYNKTDFTNKYETFYFRKVINAYENFQSFLRDDDVFIDHSYLWDIVSIPNENLFTSGVNLIILEIPNDDITNNVRLICPSNHYAKELYESRKPSILIIKEGEYYEPVYTVSITKTNKKVVKYIKEYDSTLSKTLRTFIMEVVKPLYANICKPQESNITVQDARPPIKYHILLEALKRLQFKPLLNVLNFRNKVIGVICKCEDDNTEGFVPCHPIGLPTHDSDIEFIMMTQVKWHDYIKTVTFLRKLSKKSKKHKNFLIPCDAMFKLVEDEMIIGILTESNQVIQLAQPMLESDVREEFQIPTFKNSDYLVKSQDSIFLSDATVTTSQDIDSNRQELVDTIRMETSFYNIFRNTIKSLIQNYENITIKKELEDIVSDEVMPYHEKLSNMTRILKEIYKNDIKFIGDENYHKVIKSVSSCLGKDADKCGSNPNLCVFSRENKCQLILPKKNIFTKKENSIIYVERMADEIVRYGRINSYIFNPSVYLSFQTVGYNLNENEIIMMKSSLTNEFFDALIPHASNPYVKFASYDEINSQQDKNNNREKSQNTAAKEEAVVCIPVPGPLIGIIKKCLPSNYTQLNYNNTAKCTFQIFIDLAKEKTNKVYTPREIKSALCHEYGKFVGVLQEKILDILILEGKSSYGNQVKSGKLEFNTFIFMEEYFLTPMDLWFLSYIYSVPIIFLSSKGILQTNFEKNTFICYGEPTDQFSFIILPAFRGHVIPKYAVVVNDKERTRLQFNLTSTKICSKDFSIKMEDKVTREEFLENYKTIPEVSKNKKLVIEEDSDSVMDGLVDGFDNVEI